MAGARRRATTAANRRATPRRIRALVLFAAYFPGCTAHGKRGKDRASWGGTAAMIQEATLIEAVLSIRSQIEFPWQFVVTVPIAIFALLFIYDEAVESLNFIARAFARCGGALFEWINGKVPAARRHSRPVPCPLRTGRALPADLLSALCRADLCRSPDHGAGDAFHGLHGDPVGARDAGIHSDAAQAPTRRGAASVAMQQAPCESLRIKCSHVDSWGYSERRMPSYDNDRLSISLGYAASNCRCG